MANTQATERQLKLALLVRERGPLSRASIQQALPEYAASTSPDDRERKRQDEATRRMFERDKAALAKDGIVLHADDDGCYTIDHAASTCAPLQLTGAEASLLRLTCMALIQDPGYPLKDELRMALVKLSEELEAPDALPLWLGRDAQDVGIAHTAGAKAQGTLHKVRTALAEHTLLAFDYEDAQGNCSRRTVEPVGCFFLEGYQYLAAVEPGTGRRRTFRLDRCRKVSAGKQISTAPISFRPEEWLIHSFQMGADAFEAQVAFGPEQAAQALSLTGGKGTLAALDNGGAEWTISASDAQALAAWCVEHGPGVWPVAPPEAVDAYKAGLERVMEVCHEA